MNTLPNMIPFYARHTVHPDDGGLTGRLLVLGFGVTDATWNAAICVTEGGPLVVVPVNELVITFSPNGNIPAEFTE